MTTSAELRMVFLTALKGATDAGQAVHSPFDWPTQNDSYPLIIVRAPKERKESRNNGVGAPLYDVTTTFEIVARTRSAALAGDAGSELAIAALEAIKGQIEVALINNPAVMVDPNNPSGANRIKQFASVESDISTSSDGEMPMAELSMRIEVEFVQEPADFYPIPSNPIAGFDAGVVMPDGTVEPGLSITF